MKNPATTALALVLLSAITVAFTVWPEPASVMITEGPLRAAPYALFALAAIFAAVSGQGRVLLTGFLLAWTTFLLDRFSADGNGGRTAAVMLTATIYIPIMAAVFHLVRDEGIFSVQGLTRGLIVLSGAMMMLLVAFLPSFVRAAAAPQSALLQPLSDTLKLPAIGLAALVFSLPFYFLRLRSDQSADAADSLSPVFLAFVAMNAQARSADPLEGRAALLSFMSASATVMTWSTLRQLWRGINIDELTELPGRRALKRRLSTLRPPYSIAMLDIDHFKSINDAHGHRTGDQVLRYVAAHLRNTSVGKAYRYGGEEFAIIADGPDQDTVEPELESLRKTIAGRDFGIRGALRPRARPAAARKIARNTQSKFITVTVSIGLARHGARRSNPQEILEAADKALYRAKEEGRNCLRAAK